MTSTIEKNHDSRYLAHVRQGRSGQFVIHDLDEHLTGVAKLALEFSREFGSSDWGYVAGIWHDLGKYAKEFQRRIKSVSGYDPEAHLEGPVDRVDHSTAGAQHSIEQFGAHGRILAYLIAGHHAGLPDWNAGETGGGALNVRLSDRTHLARAIDQPIPPRILTQTKPASPLLGKADGFALWVRMLFSCLVDADFLDTEAFMDEGKSEQRAGNTRLDELLQRFNAHMDKAFMGVSQTNVNRVRADVLRQCRSTAQEKPGMFSLTVPTGGGKTLSSLAFALEHAALYEKRRVIFVIPYTSIIEQTANTFRGIFPDAVVEHHSNLDPDKYETVKSRLATENWDAPLIVTTNVQFFESLFAAKTSRCRKLHNIVNSVVVLDEAQLLPPEFLQPIIHVMNLLARHYGVTFVLSTATQPALNSRSGFGWKFDGLEDVREIIADSDALYRNLERVNITLPKNYHESQGWGDIAQRAEEHESVLIVVNSRADARVLHRLMPKGTLHLSAVMCGEHRSNVIRSIKQRLKDGDAVRVVSTQLVESGVDVDFPVVYRALAGLDSIAQAAGRCNREGNLERGEVVVFVPPKPAPPGHLRKAAETTVTLLTGYEGNPLARDMFRRYFEQFYGRTPLDSKGIADLLRPDGQGEDSLKVQFRTAAQRFQLIDESGYRSVIVRYGDSPALIGRLQKEGPERWLMRKLQRYTVSLPEYQFKKLLSRGDVREVYPDMFAQTSDALYHPDMGVLVDEESNPDPSALVG